METVTQFAGPRRPTFVIEYLGKNISADIAPLVESVTYVDKLSGEADSIDIKVTNKDGRWTAGWYPAKGDTIRLLIGYEGEPMLPCGTFEVDETEFSGPPDMFSIKGVAAGVSKELRTKRTVAYDGMLLGEVATKVAARHKLRVVGKPEAIRIGRVTQNQESDLAFLKRIAHDYGHVVAVRDAQLFITPREALMTAISVLAVDREQLKSYQVRDKTAGVYRSVSISYLDPKTGKVVEHTETDKAHDKTKHADTLKIHERAENKQQAIAKARAALRDKNLSSCEADFSMIGDVRLCAGNTLSVYGMGRLSGDYQIIESKHVIGKSGYETTIQGQRIRITPSKAASKAPKKRPVKRAKK